MNNYRKQRCIAIAQSLQHLRTGRSLHFSFILKNNQLLCYATNDYRRQNLPHRFGNYEPTRENSKNYIAGLHSEARALTLYINKFGHSDVSGLTLFNVRVNVDGNILNSKPCKNCQRNIIEPLNWKKVIWT